jgi:hypothetical protein
LQQHLEHLVSRQLISKETTALETFQSKNYPLRLNIAADGKIYVGCTEHSPQDPKPRGAPFICLDAETGEELWKTKMWRDGWGGQPALADGIIATLNTYDNRIYAFGKGPSATVVSAAPKVVMHGDGVLVEGKVTDISPGTEQYALRARFPDGVPAVSDESMSDWMLHVYNQFKRPADAVGVEVVVEVLDPNGNYYEVGRTTSDSDGFFKAAFTPEVPGEYTVIARFLGSKSYYGSYAKTAINVEMSRAPTPPPTPAPASMADLYFLPMSIGMIIAIVVVIILLALILLRKR